MKTYPNERAFDRPVSVWERLAFSATLTNLPNIAGNTALTCLRFKYGDDTNGVDISTGIAVTGNTTFVIPGLFQDAELDRPPGVYRIEVRGKSQDGTAKDEMNIIIRAVL
jgi:hypothetical protein